MNRRSLLLSLLAASASDIWAIRPECIASARIALQSAMGEAPGELDAGAEPQAAVHPATEKAVARKAGGVAVIPIRGVISARPTWIDYVLGLPTASPSWIADKVRQAVADDTIKTVLLDCDSPGGVVTGVAECADVIYGLRGKKPIITQVSGQCCSAAYHLCASTDDISANPTALIGSLGVYMTHQDWSGFYAENGVVFTDVQEGAFKTEWSDHKPLSDEAAAHAKEMVGDYMTMFVDAVARGRGVPAATVRGETFGQGRCYVAARAVSRGLADRVRTGGDTFAAYGVDGAAPDPNERRRSSLALLGRDLDLIEAGL